MRKWLTTFHPEILNNKDYSRKADINADRFLPYRKNKFWEGNDALSRLKLAVKAEVIIILSNAELSEQEQQVIYRTECLRLWTRINSLRTKLSFEEFKTLLNETHAYVISHWDETVEFLQQKNEDFKPKRDQVLYHYTREDFESIRYEKSLKAAYEKWIKEVHPTLLEKYKARKLDEYARTLKQTVHEYEVFHEKMDEYKAKLDKIHIKPIKYLRFTLLIKQIKEGKL